MPHPLHLLLAPLQRSPGLRGALYLGTAAALIQAVGGWLRRDGPSTSHTVHLHLAVLPPGAALTAAGLWLDGRSPRELLPDTRDRHQLVQGALAGIVAALALQAALRATGWASAPQWGWEERPVGDVLYMREPKHYNLLGSFCQSGLRYWVSKWAREQAKIAFDKGQFDQTEIVQGELLISGSNRTTLL